MDVNDTRFHLLLGQRDWQPLLSGASARNLAWDAERSSVMLEPQGRVFVNPGEATLTLADRRGADRDRYGTWYAINEAATGVQVIGEGNRTADRFWPPERDPAVPPSGGPFNPKAPEPPGPPLPLRGLAVTTQHYLVVGVPGAKEGLLAFDLHGGGPPLRRRWPVPFRPFDMSPRPGGGVYILERNVEASPAEPPRYWALDRFFEVEPGSQPPHILRAAETGAFQPGGASPHKRPARTFPSGVSLALPGDPALYDFVAIEALPDDSLLLLARGPHGATDVFHYREGTLVNRATAFEASALSERGGPPLAHDMAFVPDEKQLPYAVTGTLYVVDARGNQAWSFRLRASRTTLQLALRPEAYPLRRFGGRALVAAAGKAYYDLGERWLPLVELPRARYAERGQLETGPMDGGAPGSVWHRLCMDACIPPGTRIRIESRTADRQEDLRRAAWQQEPDPYLREAGAEVPYYHPFTPRQRRREGTGTWELLFQRAKGRFLQVRLALEGNRRRSPRVQALRCYYPRFSYLREYLPDVYQRDETSASFLDRYLANVEGFFTEIEGHIAELQHLLDERTVQAEYLPWLARWLGAVFDPAYDEERRRLFLRHAVELFQQRGTVAGFIRAIRLATDPCPDDSLFEEAVTPVARKQSSDEPSTYIDRYGVRVVEAFQTRTRPGVIFGDPSDLAETALVTDAPEWSPRQGSEVLHERFRTFLRERYATEDELREVWAPPATLRFPPLRPEAADRRADWLVFTRRVIGFTYADVTPADREAYQRFLAQRYRRVEALETAYQRTYGSFAAVELPAADDFPSAERRLRDWVHFVSLVVPARRGAHRFTVLVPTTPEALPAEQERELAAVKRIVEIEKPAHTQAEVKPYWALFRIGGARVGFDTVVDEGSRYVAVVLGEGALAGGYLAPAHPFDVAGRAVTGRDAVGRDFQL